MVHILKQKIGNDIKYLILNRKPIARELQEIGFEHMGSLNIRLKPGQYDLIQLKKILEEVKRERMLKMSRTLLKCNS